MNVATILLVTWIISGQTPASYQTPFSSAATCEDAKAKIFAEQQRLIGVENAYVADIRQKGMNLTPRNIAVTAICTAQ
jgi:hypothetical protein